MRRLALIVAAAAIAGLVALPAGAAPERLSFVQVVEKEFTLAVVLGLQPQSTRDAGDPRRDPLTVKECATTGDKGSST